jgi:hypothetical protein
MTNAPSMTNATEIASRYIALWNETDQKGRRALIAEIWTDDASYLDPMMQGNGHDGIDTMIAGVQRQFPGYRFALEGTPDGHNNRVRFSWSLAAEGGAPVARGTDFALLSRDGRFQSVTGFLDRDPAGA